MHDSSLVILVNGQENGSATFISADGLAASASHCISFRDDKIEVISPIHGRLPAKLVAMDKGHDFLLIQVDIGERQIVHLPPAKTAAKTPDKVYQYGAPVYRRGVVQSGTIARDGIFYEYYGGYHNHYIGIVHVAASVQTGTSGGPWVNEKGEFIGVQSGTLLVGDSPSGIAFMAPVERLMPVIESKQNAVTRNVDFKVMPIETQEPNTIKRYGNFDRGLIITSISVESKTIKAGLEKWDLITAVNGKSVTSIKEFIESIKSSKDERLNMTIVSIDSETSSTLSVPIEIVEDRIGYRKEPKKDNNSETSVTD